MVAFERGFKSQANRIALGLRKQFEFPELGPLNPRVVLDHLGVQVIPVSDLMKDGGVVSVPGFSAMLLLVPGQKVLIHNDSHSSGRQSSNLAHELAHLLLGHPPENLVCNSSLERDRDSLVEAEAAYLGGCILVPNEAAHQLAKLRVDESRAAAKYGVTPEMISYRLRMSGALKRVKRSWG